MVVPNPWPAFWAAKKMNEERQKYDAYDSYEVDVGPYDTDEVDVAPVVRALFAVSVTLLASAAIGGMGYVLYKCFAPEKTDKAEKTEYVAPTSPLARQLERQMEWAVKSPNSFYEYIDKNPDEDIRKITKLREPCKTR